MTLPKWINTLTKSILRRAKLCTLSSFLLNTTVLSVLLFVPSVKTHLYISTTENMDRYLRIQNYTLKNIYAEIVKWVLKTVLHPSYCQLERTNRQNRQSANMTFNIFLENLYKKSKCFARTWFRLFLIQTNKELNFGLPSTQ